MCSNCQVIFLTVFPPLEFGMKDDLRKMEVAGVSSRELYVKRKNVSHAAHLFIDMLQLCPVLVSIRSYLTIIKAVRLIFSALLLSLSSKLAPIFNNQAFFLKPSPFDSWFCA